MRINISDTVTAEILPSDLTRERDDRKEILALRMKMEQGEYALNFDLIDIIATECLYDTGFLMNFMRKIIKSTERKKEEL